MIKPGSCQSIKMINLATTFFIIPIRVLRWSAAVDVEGGYLSDRSSVQDETGNLLALALPSDFSLGDELSGSTGLNEMRMILCIF